MAFLLTVRRRPERFTVLLFPQSLCHSLFIVSPIRIFTGRGARMRGEEPQGEGSLRKLRSPLSLRFSPSRSLIPYPLLSGARLLSCAKLRGQKFRKAGARGRKPKGKGECELCELPPSTWVVTPVPWGEAAFMVLCD